MSVESPLQYLIADEGGATALLATAFDDSADPSASTIQSEFRRKILHHCGLQFNEPRPSKILLEYDQKDLIVVWDDVLLLFEVKITASSVRPGQLQPYYEQIRDRIEDGTFRGINKVYFIFLTPDNVGGNEFKSLNPVPPDEKKHIGWTTILKVIQQSLPYDPSCTKTTPPGLEWLLHHGCSRISTLLSGREKPKVEVTDARARCREFIVRVRETVNSAWPGSDLHFAPKWSDKSIEQIFANLGGEKAGNVYLDLSPHSTYFSDPSQEHILEGKCYFKVANRFAKLKQHLFEGYASNNCALLLGIESGQKPTVDHHTLTVEVPISWRGSEEELVTRSSALFLRMLSTFRHLM